MDSQVGGENIVPISPLHAHDELVAGDARVVDQNVDLAEPRNHGLYDTLDLIFVTNIELERRRLAVYLGRQVVELFLIACAQPTFFPACARTIAQARPIPCEAPVTSATRPSTPAMIPPSVKQSRIYSDSAK